MRHLNLGLRSGLRVSELALGTGNFGTAFGPRTGADLPTARAIFESYAEAGGTMIDAADMYQAGESEVILGDLLGADRDRFVVSTKYTYGAEPTRPSALVGNSRKNMITSVEQSLRRLRIDHIDLLWAHNDDGVTPIDEVTKAFEDLISAGKIHYAGLSNFPAWRTTRAVDHADQHGWSGISAIQVEYSLAERTADRELLPMAEALGLGVLTYSPLGGGLLTGKYRSSDEGRLTTIGDVILTENSAQRTAVLDTVLDMATQHDARPSEIAVAWLLEHGRRSQVGWIPVIGPRTSDQLGSYLNALDLTLTADEITRLDLVSAPALGVPHELRVKLQDTLLGGAGGPTRPRTRPLL
ncbi:aldo/keto reductase [Amycolatopsis panacis]|uniref:Aldo/keto reductase n=1 Tax=Amycolatopsis panacis TaxID=2340917 RepID=A0A419I2K2_9PSEU|nr:aldo/keto reductase [Amycolatopsis panacis]RJQ84190.1 aldo/keto reductase [Amycolatopsis panacis]